MGGLGKSELAKQYISKNKETYPGGICWLNATEDDFISKLIELSGLGNNEALKQRKDLADKIKYCYNNWQWQGNVLLVFDDVQNYQQIKLYLPTQSQFKVLITTRKQLGKPVVRLDLDVLSPAAALELLASFLDDDRIAAERETAEELCQWLGYLPLGLELVGRYLAEDEDLSCQEVLESLKENSVKDEALAEAAEEMCAELGIVAAIDLSWQQLTPQAQKLAYILSLFALARIPWELVEKCLDTNQITKPKSARKELTKLYLLKRVEKKTYLFHTLIREFLHTKESQFNSEELKQSLCKAIVAVGKKIPKNITVDKVTTFSPFIPHLEEVATHLPDYLTDEDLITPFVGLGDFYHGQGLYNLEEPWLVQGKEIALTSLGDEHSDTAIILNNLAEFYEYQGRYEEAEPLYLQALEIVKIALPDNHPSLASILNNLAGLYKSQGRYEEVEPLYLQALEIVKIALPPNHPKLPTYIKNLAELYRCQGRYEEAEPLFLQAIEIVKIALPPNHPRLATKLSNLAELYRCQGRYEEAEPLYLQAIEIYKIALPDNHPKLANPLHSLALLYSDQGRYEEAEPLFLQSIEIHFNSVGESHPHSQKLQKNFDNFIEQVVKEGREKELSNHPLVQKAITKIKNQ